MQKDRRKDNRGMTLLEVIIAVSIFSIAAIILMQGFVTSGRINKKSNLYLEATSTAQNVMEEIKAKSFEKTALAFNYPVDPTYSEGGFSRFHFLEQNWGNINQPEGILIREKIYDSAGAFVNVKTKELGGREDDPLSATILSDDKGKTYTFNPRKKGDYASQYFFEMLNVQNRKETFDIRVAFNGGKDSDYKKENAFAEDEKNDYESPNIAKLDNKKNGFLIMNKVWDDTALDTMLAAQLVAAQEKWTEDEAAWRANPANYKTVLDGDGNPVIDEITGQPKKELIPFPIKKPEQELDRDDVYQNMRRTLHIKLYDNNGIITAKAWYKLCAWDYDVSTPENPYATFKLCSCGGRGKNENETITGCFCTHNSVESAFYSSEANEALKNLYIFYYPNYNSTNRADPLDAIIFDNMVNYPVDLYVVKQATTEMENLGTFSNSEKAYRMNLTIQENPADYGFSNWYTNPALFRAKTKLRTNLGFDISEKVVSKRQTVMMQKNLVYVDGSGKSVRDITAENILSFNGLDDRQQKDRIYKVTVEVYKQGASENGYSKSDLIVSLEGSRED